VTGKEPDVIAISVLAQLLQLSAQMAENKEKVSVLG
jgi:xanthine dehydrogenase accessory factor